MRTRIPRLAALLLWVAPPAHGQDLGGDDARPAVTVGRALDSARGAVACVERHAATIGAEVLAEGGNAIDAAVATAFALAVTWPGAGNVGGGGFMLVALADGATTAIDYRETAPLAVGEDLFLDADGAIDPLKVETGYFVVGVPGTVAGLELAHRRHGTLPWPRLVRPARELAERGFPVGAALARELARHAEALRRFPASARCFLRPDGAPPAEGDLLVQPDLANTLRWIESDGARAFYEGPIAALLAAEMRRAGAPMNERDLAAYRPVVREALHASYRGTELLLMPPPSSGGVAIAQILGMLEPFDLRARGAVDAHARHLLAEASRLAFAERALHLGDPDASPVPVAELLRPGHVATLRASIDPEHAAPSERFGPPLSEPDRSHTTHFSILDAAGNAVANTYTLEETFGSKLVAEGTGFLLNNELHDFNVRPGTTDRSGRIGTAPNLVRPGRRPLSSMSPCIARRDGEVVLVTGSPGGRTIISTVAQVLWFTLEFGDSIDDAVARPRQHHGWFPDELRVEPGVEAGTRAELGRRGHRVAGARDGFQGDAHTLARDPATGVVRGVADRRIDGWVGAPAAGESASAASAGRSGSAP